MCSSCGGKTRSLPGGRPNNPIIFGEPTKTAARTATFLKDHAQAAEGAYQYVNGTGVDAAVEAGDIVIGYQQTAVGQPRVKRTIASSAPEWYVRIGNNKWIGFKTKAAAERRAKSEGGTVATRDEILNITGGQS